MSGAVRDSTTKFWDSSVSATSFDPMKNGFHEDGLSSGLDVARSILANDTLPIAAE